MRMRLPDAQQPFVDLGGSAGRFYAQRISVVVAPADRRRAQVNDGVVSAHLSLLGRADRLPEAVRTRPVRRAVDCSAVAQHNSRVVGVADAFKLTLYEEDGTL